MHRCVSALSTTAVVRCDIFIVKNKSSFVSFLYFALLNYPEVTLNISTWYCSLGIFVIIVYVVRLLCRCVLITLTESCFSLRLFLVGFFFKYYWFLSFAILLLFRDSR